ncbi:hypothetical protein D3C80_1257400 [compost metagenome]
MKKCLFVINNILGHEHVGSSMSDRCSASLCLKIICFIGKVTNTKDALNKCLTCLKVSKPIKLLKCIWGIKITATGNIHTGTSTLTYRRNYTASDHLRLT